MNCPMQRYPCSQQLFCQYQETTINNLCANFSIFNNKKQIQQSKLTYVLLPIVRPCTNPHLHLQREGWKSKATARRTRKPSANTFSWTHAASIQYAVCPQKKGEVMWYHAPYIMIFFVGNWTCWWHTSPTFSRQCCFPNSVIVLSCSSSSIIIIG